MSPVWTIENYRNHVALKLFTVIFYHSIIATQLLLFSAD